MTFENEIVKKIIKWSPIAHLGISYIFNKKLSIDRYDGYGKIHRKKMYIQNYNEYTLIYKSWF